MKTFNDYLNETGEIGYIEETIDYLIYANGLPNAMPHEIVMFETGDIGQVLSLSIKFVEILVFSKQPVKVGAKVTRTNKLLEVPAGPELLGQTIDPLVNPIELNSIFKKPDTLMPLDVTPYGISFRKKVQETLETGVTLVDLTIPLGKGQRELVIGDRKSGKTNFIAHTILNQAKKGDICIYAAVGKKRLDIKRAEEFFERNGVLKNIIIIASSPQDPSSIIYLTPYTAMAIAEYFRDQGKNVLVVLDDLSSHAKFYREIALLGKRFPGRNSYPGDIFHVHSKLLERSGNFIINGKEAAITCLPVVETTQGDLSGYIQTNLMSMTDGHIFFDNDLFVKGRRPAINPFLSVTRVGHQAQSQLRREINRELISFLTLFEKIQNYVHFGAELNESVKNTVLMGERILSLFDQPLHITLPINLQVFLFCSLWAGVWSNKTSDEMKSEIEKVVSLYEKNKTITDQINKFTESFDSFNKLLGDIKQEYEQIFPEMSAKESPPPAKTETTTATVNEEKKPEVRS